MSAWMTMPIFVASFMLMYAVGYWVCRPVGWWLFRLAHRNNAEALAFADRESRSPKTSFGG